MWNGRNVSTWLVCWAFLSTLARGFSVGRNLSSQRAITTSMAAAGQGFGTATVVPEKQETTTKESEISTLSSVEIKEKLLTLLPSMIGTDAEFRLVEQYVNALEDSYTPPVTLDFLNLAMSGDWQLLFSTNLSGSPKPYFRLRELVQTVAPKGLEGSITNVATWDLAQDTSNFDASGTFSVKCSYNITQGARMVVELDDHVLDLARGSSVPNDVPALVGMLHRSMPKEMFDPHDHAMDTTYLDENLRITRYTGPRLEGVRDIFVRVGSIEIDPTAGSSNDETQ